MNSLTDENSPSSPVCYAQEVDPAYMGLTTPARVQYFAPGLSLAEGPVVSFLGFPYPTRMAVIELASGGLFVWSPIALSGAIEKEIDAMGPVHHLVSPNALHHIFLNAWKRNYPNARAYAPPGLRNKRADISFAADLEDRPEPAWDEDIDQVIIRGSFALTEVVFFHRKSRTAIFGDLIQNFDSDWFKGWRGLVAKLDGIVAPDAGAPREIRATFFDRRTARQALDRILAWPIENVVMAHGRPVRNNAHVFVERAFRWLVKR